MGLEPLHKAVAQLTDEDGWARLDTVGTYALTLAPDPDTRSCGHSPVATERTGRLCPVSFGIQITSTAVPSASDPPISLMTIQLLKGSLDMSLLPLHALEGLIDQYGYAVIFFCITLESLGLPLPGESLMIAAALYAARTQHLNIFIVVPLAAAGAICGDQIGYAIGRWIGYRLLARWGAKVSLTDQRLELGRFLFRKYGGGVVFFGRFIAFLRTFAAVLAGANRMPWHTFLLWNTLGGIGWTALYGFGAYVLGDAVKRISGPVGLAMAVVGGVTLLTAIIFVHRNESRLIEDARREMNPTH